MPEYMIADDLKNGTLQVIQVEGLSSAIASQ